MTEDRDLAAIPHAARPLPRPRRRFAVVAVLSLAAAIAAVCLAAPFLTRRSPPPAHDAPSDPRLLYEGPYRNIRPDVAYVGDKACASCHADISRSYRRHPMGRSLTPIADAEEAQWYDAAHHNPFPALGEIFQVERRGRRVWHTETRRDANDRPLYTFETEVLYAVGSGTRGRSYLTDRDGYLFQTAISWYAQKSIWDLSPGFQPDLLTGRPVPGECLFCHANRTRFQEGSLNHYDTPVFDGHAIGCERCHGPGAKHVASTDPLDIVCPNTERLTPDLCEAVCEQCHLEGAHRVVRRQRGLYDFRPGLPLQDFWRVFVQSREEGEREHAVTHVEQMHASRCYQGGSGAGRMLCTSCHDPHIAVADEERVAYYRRRCLACHQDKGCSLPRRVRLDKQADDSCIACHMPRSPTANIVHTAATDHRIPRRPPATAKEERLSADVDRPLRSFHPYRPEDEAEVRRDLGLALVEGMRFGGMSVELHSARAASLLEEAAKRDAEDVPAGEALGLVLLMRHRRPQALAVLEDVLSRDSKREAALTAAASLAWNLGRPEEGLEHWRRLVAVNPWLAGYRRSLTQALLQLRKWDEAREQCRDWLRLDPASIEARQAWVALLLRDDKKTEAREEFARLEALNPPNLAQLRAWFERQTH
jgi:tetratricopeptide (TPR) repeat protein